MKKLLTIAAAAAALCGCSVTKVNYKKDADGDCEYRIYHNDHWLKRDTGAMSGGMGHDGKFEVKLESASVSPSEEFNRTMQTYTTAFVQLAQIVAAAYNPSASAATKSAEPAPTVVNVQPTPVDQSNTQTTKQSNNLSPDCTDGSCKDTDCADGSCKPPEAK